MKVLRNNRIVADYQPARKPAPGFSDLGSRLLEAIRDAERRGEVPSVRELRDRCGISSTSVVLYHLRRLAVDGDITLGERGKSRSYKLTEQGRGLPSDEELLRRCLVYLETELSSTGGALVEDLKQRLGE
jgi:Mn-dependent DtxR family transcriptional regulator